MSLELDHVLRHTNTRLCYLPACSTHLAQPSDQFIIAKIKNTWNRRWELKKAELIEAREWQNNPYRNRGWLGKLKNPRKEYFFAALELQLVREVEESQKRIFSVPEVLLREE